MKYKRNIRKEVTKEGTAEQAETRPIDAIPAAATAIEAAVMAALSTD